MRYKLSVAVLLALILVAAAAAPRREPAAIEDGIAVYFSPEGGAAMTVVDAFDSAQKTIDVAIFSITQKDIVKALIAADKRGVKVRIILDSDQASEKYSSATYLAKAGLTVWTNPDQTIHHKYSVVDGKIILTGSFNYSTSADLYNAENLLVIRGKQNLSKAYAANFEGLLKNAVRYKSSSASSND